LTGPATFTRFCERIGLRLEPFQKRIAKAAAGPERELVVLLPRGQGKTTLMAAIALHHLLTVPRAAVYCAASSREQARILFEAAAMFTRTLDHPNIVVRHLELRYCDDPEQPNVFTRHLRVLAADAPKLHGLTPSLAIIDELHAHPDDEVYLALRTATLKRPESQLITISTAGQGADSPLGRLRGRALGQPDVRRRGAFTDARGPNLRMFEWSVPEDDDITKAVKVKKANPASWITTKGLREQHEAVAEVAYRRYHCNQWTAQVGAWLPAGAWQACAGEVEFTAGERIWVGVDVGGERSASAVVYVNENLHVGVETWTGDEAVLEVAAYVAELAERYQIVEAVFDPWRAGQMAQEWEQRGIPAVAFPQSDSRMIPRASACTTSSCMAGSFILMIPTSTPMSTPLSLATPGVAGASRSPTARRTSTPSSRSRWRSTVTRTSPSRSSCSDGCSSTVRQMRDADPKRELLLEVRENDKPRPRP
jgi:phage terminase large subunit-like protein